MNIDLPSWHPLIFQQRLRRQRRGLRARGQRDGARGNSNGKFQKVAAFHDIFLWVARASDAGRVWPRRDEWSLNSAFSDLTIVVPALSRDL